MFCKVIVFIFLLYLVNSRDIKNGFFQDSEDLVMKMHQHISQNEQKVGTFFSWTNCGNKDDPVQVKQLSVLPDPLPFPGNITLAVNVNNTIDLKSPIKVDLELYKHEVFIWIPIPCIDNVGSCTYDDICELLATIPECPPELKKYGITCKCPILKADYVVPTTTIDVVIPGPIPTFLVSGKYKARANVTNAATNEPIICLEVTAELTKQPDNELV